VAYAAAHPRRTIPKFGPYLLLQTLGEGEFGKVKLGLHMQWGEEVAVKLIRRGNIDTSARMSKVEREIEVLRVRFRPLCHLVSLSGSNEPFPVVLLPFTPLGSQTP
jgi:serine/threonine protein kinase